MDNFDDVQMGDQIRFVGDHGWDGAFTTGEVYTVTDVWFDHVFNLSCIDLDGTPVSGLFVKDFEKVV